MTDISKCYGIECPIKESCWRFKAPDNPYWQSYSLWEYNKKTKTCEGYWKYERPEQTI